MYQGRCKEERYTFEDIMWLYWDVVGGCLIVSKNYKYCQGWIIPAASITGHYESLWVLLYKYVHVLAPFGKDPFWIL